MHSANPQKKILIADWSIVLPALAVVFVAVTTATAQFNSGSTGADGALDVGTLCGAAATCTLQIRDEPNHVFNYTTINIPSGKTLKFLPNAQNSPVYLLASGTVTIAGSIDVSGAQGNSTTIGGSRIGGIGGPGGYNGGGGGFSVAPYFNGISGAGPGGGGGGGTPDTGSSTHGGSGGFSTAGTGTLGGPTYGTRTLVPLIGGSGGAGGQGSTTNRGCGGGGGGGALLIASSSTITFSGSATLLSRGGSGNNFASGVCPNQNGGGGSGGAVRIIGNTLTGPVSIQVNGGGSNSSQASAGRVRIQGTELSGLAPSVSPTGSAAIFNISAPTPVFPSPVPTLRITSVGGQTIPANPSNSPHGNPDVTLPQSLPNPVVIIVTGQNVPIGTFVRLVVTPQYGSPTTSIGSELTGTIASSTTTETVVLPDGLSLITAITEFDAPGARPGQKSMYVDGERVQRVQVTAGLNGKSEVTYITASGRKVKAEE